MKISSIKQNIAFTNNNKNAKDSISNKKAAFIIPVIVLASSPLTDSCSRLEQPITDEFMRRDSIEVVDTVKPDLDIQIDTTLNEIHHEFTI